MTTEVVDYAKGETPMTDLQFNAFNELREKYEALLQEVAVLRVEPVLKTDDVLSDYQFQRFEKVRDQCEVLSKEVASLLKENARLKLQLDMLKTSSRRSRV